MMIDNRTAPARAKTQNVEQPAGAGGKVFCIDLTKLDVVVPSDDSKLATALDAFKAEIRKSPQERCREEVMKEWHITDDELQSLPPDEQRAMTTKINQEVARRLRAGQPEKGGPGDGAAALPTSTLDMLQSRSVANDAVGVPS